MESRHSDSWTYKANWVWNKRAVGGKLTLIDKEIHFEPHAIDRNPSRFSGVINSIFYVLFKVRPITEYEPAEEFRISFSNIKSIEKEPPRQRGLKDTIKAGGLRSRMRIQLNDGSEELFVVSNLSETRDEITSIVDL